PVPPSVPPLLSPPQPSGAEYTLPSHSCISWIVGQRGRVRLAIGRALPMWSLWPWLTSMTSQRVTSSGASGLLGLANHGSKRTTTPPGVTISTQAWPYHVIVVLPPVSIRSGTSAGHRIGSRRRPSAGP